MGAAGRATASFSVFPDEEGKVPDGEAPDACWNPHQVSDPRLDGTTLGSRKISANRPRIPLWLLPQESDASLFIRFGPWFEAPEG